MLCRANVSLPDWPEGTLRDVDPKDEIIQGFLRAGFAVPMIRQSVKQAATPPAPPKPAAKRAKASDDG